MMVIEITANWQNNKMSRPAVDWHMPSLALALK
jgi:hypothetical protein